ncbi:MAG: helix-turn-helix domain-containing protein [Bacteroidales bacterium]|nr:helix-turn-helix domain-containing protein [Bacteroidales bacterium]
MNYAQILKEHVDRYVKIYACVFISIGVLSIPLPFLTLNSVYFVALQSIIWFSLGCLFFIILKDDPMPVSLSDSQSSSQTPQLLREEEALYNNVLEDAGDTYEKLITFFNDHKPYLKAGINVNEVAVSVGTNRAYLSRFINDRLNLNFNQFVNSYRVKEAQRVITEQGVIALPKLCKMVGFTSMATFTVAFKLNTGMTPGEWCKHHKRRTH